MERTSVGLDVHARSVVAASIDGVTGELVQTRLTPSHEHIRSWLSGLPGPVVRWPMRRGRPGSGWRGR
jgi:transposase